MHRQKRRWVLLGVVGVLAGWSAAWAQESRDKVAMETVVVTASREKEKATAVPAHITVITDEQISHSTAGNLAELLQEQGFHVSDIAGNKRNYSVDLRGFGESAPANTLVLVDGRRVNQPDLSAADWVLIPLERIARVEVIRGGRGSVLYGDNASGGVVNIITKEGARSGGSVSARYGSYETFEGAAAGTAASDRWSLDLTGNYLDSDGYRDNSATRMRDAGANLRLDPSDRLGIQISSGFHDDTTRLPGALKESDFDQGIDRTETLYPDNYSETEDMYVNAAADLYVLTNDTVRLEASARQRNRETRVFFAGLGGFAAETELDTLTFSPQLILRENFGAVANRLILGYDYQRFEEKIDNRLLSDAEGQGYNMDKINHGYFAMDELQVAQGVTLSGGFRRDEAEYRFDPSDKREITLEEQAYTVGINYAFGQGSHLFASFARSFRYPLLDELFQFLDNSIKTDFEEQTSKHVEIGIRYQATEELAALLSYFRTSTRDEIFYDKLLYENRNLDGKTIREGIELGLRWHAPRVGAGVDYTLMRADIEGGRFDGMTVPDAPQHQGAAHAYVLLRQDLRLDLNAQYVGERYFISDFDNNLDEQKDYLLVNSKIQYTWRRLKLFLNLNNLLNEEYSAYGVETTYGFDHPRAGEPQRAYYPSPKFNWMIGVEAEF